ncbi:thiamine diphosphokinase [Furfurilactobacillus curtus]|uniref:Thiamine diphosphokinase n=2 Tax=Furfurilactobacillus curtus TaxID=1746200 RepID=A0ABQ5JKI2_9LACO
MQRASDRPKLSRLNILVGGPRSEWPPALAAGQISGPWIGVDRGAIRLLELGITPIIALGDFDSSKQGEFERVQAAVKDLRQVGSAKDETDTQLGVRVAMTEFSADEIVIYGATGGRLDHLLANLFLPLETRFRAVVARLIFVDRQNEIRYFLPGRYQIDKLPEMRYLAFVTFGEVGGLTLSDERYQLDHVDIHQPISFASNEFVGQTATFSFTSGIVAVVQSTDLSDNRAERYNLNA